MTESERLAAEQQQQVSAGSSNRFVANTNEEANRRTLSRASDLDAAAAKFVKSNVGNRNNDFDLSNVGDGGYNNMRSWSRQSKWSSGKFQMVIL